MLFTAAALLIATPVSIETSYTNRSILVFSKTAGYRHDSIPAGRKAILDIGAERGWSVTFTEDANLFDKNKLKAFDALVFLSTTGDVLNPEQEKAMTGFVRNGGGFAGVHAASDTEYDWPWYGHLVGAWFLSHPAQQEALIKIEDGTHPCTQHLPNPWTRKDEWYDFKVNPRGKVHVLASLEPTSYKDSKMPGDHPIMWCQEFEGGRSWYTALGHTQESYQETNFLKVLAEGIEWSCAKSKRLVPSGAEQVTWKGTKGWAYQPGSIVNSGQSPEPLMTNEQFGDATVHVEFRIPKGSNSGIYLMGRYEIQILDSFGKTIPELTFADCGGVYQRWKDEAGYEGKAPLANAVRAPGEWNSFDIKFEAPRILPSGKKSNARFVEVKLNGVVVQKDVQVTGPTRASFFEDEVERGPIVLQADHGPVEFRNVWVSGAKSR